MKHMQTKIVATTLAMLCVSFSTNAFALSAEATSTSLVSAARSEVARGSSDTSCSAFVKRVLNRAGYRVQGFMANDFGAQARRYMPSWSAKAFRAGSEGRGSLRAFLNNAPNNTAFVAQWIRSGRSGHVAIVVKEANNLYRIYQAQMGLSRPHSKQVGVDRLLYSRNSYGDRSNLRVYFQ